MKNKEIMFDFMQRVMNDILSIEDSFLLKSPFLNISTNEFHVLDAVAQSGDFNSMKEISKRLKITQGSLSTAVSILEKKKYLQRLTDAKDKRSVKIILTEEGKKANAYHQKFHKALVDTIYRKLSKEDMNGFVNGLSAIDNFLKSKGFESEIAEKINNIVILTDSTSDIDSESAKELGVEIVPLSVTFGDKSFTDGIDLDKAEFYKMQNESEHIPVTSRVNPESFLSIFNRCKEKGQEVIYVGVSSNLSGTIQSAQYAKELCEYEKICIFDSRSASCGEQAFLKIACDLREKGKNAFEIKEELEKMRKSIHLFAVIDSIAYLDKGGRASAKESKEPFSLNSKPVLTFNNEGQLKIIDMPLGRKNAFDCLLKRIKNLNIDEKKPIILTYSYNRELYSDFEDFLKQNEVSLPIIACEAGAVIGTHTGPNCLAIAVFEK